MELGVLGSAQSLHVAPSTESTCLLGECVRACVRLSVRVSALHSGIATTSVMTTTAPLMMCVSALRMQIVMGVDCGGGGRGWEGNRKSPLPHPFPCDRVFFSCILNTTCDVLGAEGGSDAGTV